MNKDTKKIKQNTLQKQQWAKFLSVHYSTNLALNNPESPLKKGYDNTFHCNKIKTYNGEKMIAKYCKNRWCITCNRIRTAVNILNYTPQVSKMGHPFMVTLTRPTVDEEESKKRYLEMEKTWRRIYKTSSDKKGYLMVNHGTKLKGIRKSECTLRPENKYHFHYHFIIDGFYQAEWLINEWLIRNRDADTKAQDARPLDLSGMIEVLKYATKLSIDLDNENDYKRLDHVFQVFKGKRIISPFGGIKIPKPGAEEEFELEAQYQEELKIRLGNEHSIWAWEIEAADWINPKTGEMLIGEAIPERICQKLKDKALGEKR